MKQLKNDIKNKCFKNVYLFYGEENYLKKHYEDKMISNIIPKGAEMMNLDIYDGKNISVDKIIDASSTAPFMNEYRLIIAKASELFTFGRKNDTEKMAMYISDISDTTIIIFSENKVDKRNKLYKEISKLGYCAEFKTPSEKELSDWIIEIFKKSRKNISLKNALYMLKTIGSDMEIILNETNKLIDYKKNSNEINETDIENICTKSLENKIFDLVDSIGNKKSKKALDIYSNLILYKESPIMILSMIARQFKIILQSKYLLKKGLSSDEIAKKLEQRSFVIKECLKQSSNFKYNELLNAFNDCLEYDLKIKTGKISDKLGVEMLIIKYSSKM